MLAQSLLSLQSLQTGPVQAAEAERRGPARSRSGSSSGSSSGGAEAAEQLAQRLRELWPEKDAWRA